MARVQQLSPGNYKSSGTISAEFEGLIRYLNAAELGNKTIGELLAQIFNTDGIFSGPVQMRNVLEGLQFRVGVYSNDTTGWQTLISAASLRGTPGIQLGTTPLSPIGTPTVSIATASQTIFDFAHTAGDNALVWRNGVLQRPTTDYTLNPLGGSGSLGSLVMVAAQPLNTVITACRVRNPVESQYARSDVVTASSQSSFSIPLALASSDISVFYNGLLQREGPAADYTRQPLSNTILFNAAVPTSNLITIWGFSQSQTIIPGIMQEGTYVTATTGLIRYERLGIGSGQIPNDRVNGLAALMSAGARLHIGALPPSVPATTRFWLDTGSTPTSFKVWDGAVWLRTSIENVLPTTSAANSGQVLRVNGTGSGYELAAVDLSSVIPRTWRGAANGVASLDGDGRILGSQLPSIMPADTIFWTVNGAVSNGSYLARRNYGQRILITGFAGRLSSGTASAQITVSGTPVGPVFSLSASPVEQPLGTPIEVDASTASRAIGVVITAASSANNPEVSLACRTVFV